MADIFAEFGGEEITPKSKVKAKLQEKGKLKSKEPEKEFSFEDFGGEEVASQPVESPTKPLPVEAAPVKEEGLWSKTKNVLTDVRDTMNDMSGTAIQFGSQGFTGGFQDEISGRVNAAIDTVLPKDWQMHPEAKTWGERVDKNVNESRLMNQEYADRNPVTAFVTEGIGGAGAPGLSKLNEAARIGGATARTAKTIGLGASSGVVGAAGSSNKKITDDAIIEDEAMGAGLGAAVGVIPAVVGEIGNAVGNVAKWWTTKRATGNGVFPEGRKFVGNPELVAQAERAPIDKRVMSENINKTQDSIPTELPEGMMTPSNLPEYTPPVSKIPNVTKPDFNTQMNQEALKGAESITKALKKQKEMASASYEAAKKIPEMEKIVKGRESAAPRIYETITDRLPLLTELDSGAARKLSEIRDTLHVIRDGQPVKIRESQIVNEQPVTRYNYMTKNENLDVLVRAKREVNAMIPRGLAYENLDNNQKMAVSEIKEVRAKISKILDAETDALPEEARKLWKEGDRLHRVYKGSEQTLKKELGKKKVDPTKGGQFDAYIDEGKILTASKMDPSFQTSSFIDQSLEQIGAPNPVRTVRGVRDAEVQFGQDETLREQARKAEKVQFSQEETIRGQAVKADNAAREFEDKLKLENLQKPFNQSIDDQNVKLNRLRTLETEYNTAIQERPGLLNKLGGTKPSLKLYNYLKVKVNPKFAAAMRMLMLGDKGLSKASIGALSRQHGVPVETIEDINENPEKHMGTE